MSENEEHYDEDEITYLQDLIRNTRHRAFNKHKPGYHKILYELPNPTEEQEDSEGIILPWYADKTGDGDD